MRFYAKDKYAARWCEVGSQERKQAAARTLEWDFGSALTLQWASLQPEQRRSDTFTVTGPPTVDMDWQDRIAGGKMGVRTFVAGLLMWGNVLPLCEDGATAEDWNRLACDCIRVLRVRRAQVCSASDGAQQNTSANGGSGAPPSKRKRYVPALLSLNTSTHRRPALRALRPGREMLTAKRMTRTLRRGSRPAKS